MPPTGGERGWGWEAALVAAMQVSRRVIFNMVGVLLLITELIESSILTAAISHSCFL